DLPPNAEVCPSQALIPLGRSRPSRLGPRASLQAMRFCHLVAVIALLCAAVAAQTAEPAVAPTLSEPVSSVPGALVLVGGGGLPKAIRDYFLELAGGKRARLVVIPTASSKADTPDQLKSFGYWRDQDVASVTLLHTRRREQANDPTFARPLHDATGVWLSGG